METKTRNDNSRVISPDIPTANRAVTARSKRNDKLKYLLLDMRLLWPEDFAAGLVLSRAK